MTERLKVLFVCSQNRIRSLTAESCSRAIRPMTYDQLGLSTMCAPGSRPGISAERTRSSSWRSGIGSGCVRSSDRN